MQALVLVYCVGVPPKTKIPRDKLMHIIRQGSISDFMMMMMMMTKVMKKKEKEKMLLHRFHVSTEVSFISYAYCLGGN